MMMREQFDLGSYLQRARQTILPSREEAAPLAEPPQGPLYVGADLGTAYLVLVVLDADRQVVAGEYQFAQVVKDGLVVDYMGAVDKLSAMKNRLEARLGRELTSAASAYPPGVPLAEVRATANVVEAAGFSCSGLVDEPSAANYLLGVENGAIVDIGGGTTGIAVIEDGKVVYTADEATGGTHFTLVIAGAKDLSFEEKWPASPPDIWKGAAWSTSRWWAAAPARRAWTGWCSSTPASPPPSRPIRCSSLPSASRCSKLTK
jgi:ethanolamine utilization protein EutJ